MDLFIRIDSDFDFKFVFFFVIENNVFKSFIGLYVKLFSLELSLSFKMYRRRFRFLLVCYIFINNSINVCELSFKGRE